MTGRERQRAGAARRTLLSSHRTQPERKPLRGFPAALQRRRGVDSVACVATWVRHSAAETVAELGNGFDVLGSYLVTELGNVIVDGPRFRKVAALVAPDLLEHLFT